MFLSTLKWFLPSTNINSNRNISNTSVCFDDGVRLSGHTHKVNNFERKMLVWMGKYKNAQEVPAYVAPETVEKVRSRMRIRISNWTMAITLIGCLIMVISGKKARDRGESLHKQNLDMHENYRKEHATKDK